MKEERLIEERKGDERNRKFENFFQAAFELSRAIECSIYMSTEDERIEDETRLCTAPRSERLVEKKFLPTIFRFLTSDF